MNVFAVTPKIIHQHIANGVYSVFAPVKIQNSKDIVDISFKGDEKDFSHIKPVNLDNAQEISGIHCPGCGIKMLSAKDYEALVKRAENVQNCSEFVELLKEYRKFIPTNMRKILSNTENPSDYDNKTIREYYLEHRNEAYGRKRDRIRNIRHFLQDYSRNIDENLRENYLKDVNNIHSNDTYHDYKNKINNIIEKYISSQDEKNHLRKRTLKDIATCSHYFSVFNIPASKYIPDNKIAKILVERIFKNSVSNIVPIETYPTYINHPHNKVLICDNCKSHSSKNVFWKSDSNPRLKDNISKYLSDIAILMGEGKIESNKNYINTFCNFTNILSANKVNFKEKDVAHFQNLFVLVKRHEKFEPIVQTKVDVPCAECGSIMLPHSIRSDIEDELSDCCCPKEYAQVLKKYNKYIGFYAKDFAQIFLDIVEKNPEISNEDFMKIFRKKADILSKKEVYWAIKRYESHRDYILEKRTVTELDNFDRIDANVRKYVHQGKLDDFNYLNFFNECISGIDLRNSTKCTSVLLYDISKICFKNSITRVNGLFDSDDNDAVHTVLFNIFKSDVATADHLIAAAKGGDNSKNNLIGLCRSCNNLKSSKSVNSWYTQHMMVRRNFLNHLQVVNNMAKSGEIEDFDDWAENIAQTMYDKTNHAFDVRGKVDEDNKSL